jgi:hypothetical protein
MSLLQIYKKKFTIIYRNYFPFNYRNSPIIKICEKIIIIKLLKIWEIE